MNYFPDFNEKKLFPGIELISNGIDEKSMEFHHFHQPDFFIRVRPGKRKLIEKKSNVKLSNTLS